MHLNVCWVAQEIPANLGHLHLQCCPLFGIRLKERPRPVQLPYFSLIYLQLMIPCNPVAHIYIDCLAAALNQHTNPFNLTHARAFKSPHVGRHFERKPSTTACSPKWQHYLSQSNADDVRWLCASLAWEKWHRRRTVWGWDCQGGGWYPSRVGKRARRRVAGDSGAAWKRKLFKWRIIMAVGRQDARLPSQPHNDAPHKVCKLLSLLLHVPKGVGLGCTGVEWSVLATMRVATVLPSGAQQAAAAGVDGAAAYYGNPSKVTSQSGSAYGNSFV